MKPISHAQNPSEVGPIAARQSWINSFWVDFCCVFCIFFIYAGSSVPAINEPHYWTKAAHFWNADFGKGDLFLESGDAHWLFFASFGYLTQLMPIAWAVWTGRFLTWIFLAFGWTMLGRSLWFDESRTVVSTVPVAESNSSRAVGSTSKLGNSRDNCSTLMASCWGLVWLAGLHYGHWAGEWVVGGCESKGIAYALIFAGLALAIQRRWTLAWTLLGGATAFHVVTGIWVIVCVATVSFIIDRSTPQGKQSLGRWITVHRLGWVLCLVGVIVGAVPAIAIDWGTDPVLASESAVKQVYTRLGHHLAPTRFSPVRWQDFGMQLVCVGIAGWMAMQSKWQAPVASVCDLGDAMRAPTASARGSADAMTFPRGFRMVIGWGLFGFGIAMLGLLIDLALGRAFPKLASTFLRFYLFRWNDVAMPMMLGAIVVSFAYGRLMFTRNPLGARWFACAGALVPGLILLGYRYEANMNEAIPAGDKAHFVAKSDSEEDQLKQFKDWLRVCAWIRANSDTESLWLTPRRQQSFKWHTGRPELACWKDAPQNAESLVEWSQRLADAYQFNKEKILQPWTTEKLWELQKKYGIRYVLLDLRIAKQAPPLLPILYPSQSELNDTFAVFEIPPQKENASR